MRRFATRLLRPSTRWRRSGVDEPRLDAELLLGEAMGCERAALIADSGAEVPPAAGRRFGEMVRRRLRREPVAYILGRKGFRDLELTVDRRVLIPRPETELLVELAARAGARAACSTSAPARGRSPSRSPTSCPACEVTATDTSPAALEVARANAERLGLADRVRFLGGTLPRGRRLRPRPRQPPLRRRARLALPPARGHRVGAARGAPRRSRRPRRLSSLHPGCAGRFEPLCGTNDRSARCGGGGRAGRGGRDP